MPMSQSKLADELKAMTPTIIEAVAISRLTNAYGNYASDAMGAGIPITPAGVALGKAAMSAALAGLSVPGAALALMVSALGAFWGAVCGGFAVSFPTSVAATPPPQAALMSGLMATFAANMAGNLPLDTAAAAIAAVMHANAIIGGTVVLPGPPPVPGPII